jgi:beta-xylosidase
MIHNMLEFTFIIWAVLTLSYCQKEEKNNPVNPNPDYTIIDTLYTYTNPVGGITQIGDPYILLFDGNYYLYATSSDHGFKVWESSNLVDWTDKGLALDRNSTGNKWGKGNFWAPEVKFYKGDFYMTYSAIGENDKMKIRIAKCKSPLGPFVNWSNPFLNSDQNSYIDADLFIDDLGVYLFYVKDCSENIIGGKHVSQIFVSALNADLNQMTGIPKLILSPDQPWENPNSEWQWNEGPFVMKYDNKYYLFYSANYFASADYSVGTASSDSPMGSWTKFAGNPVLKKNPEIHVSGPGHCMVTCSPDSSEFFIVYHSHVFFDQPDGNRNVCIDRLVFDNGIPQVLGPTRSPQPLPSGVSYRILKY